MNVPRAILLDLDNTLLDARGLPQALDRARSELATRVGVGADFLAGANREVWATYWPAVEREWQLGLLQSADLDREAWRRTLSACGCVDESIVELAVATYGVQVEQTMRLFDDVPVFFDRMIGRVKLGLVSNGATDTQRKRLRGLGIERNFDAIALSGEHAVRKPDPAIFRVALERLEIRPEDAWHVGDSLQTDVAGARAAGMTAVWLNRAGVVAGTNEPRPDLECSSMMQILDAVDSL